MNILILNGSPRANGETKKMINCFTTAANNHNVTVVDVCSKNIKGCLACEYCHEVNTRKCIQEDDMDEIYPLLEEAEML
ncbi:MAG: NAD(P)H-dependent oxidoreductase, partial [Clostridia bacterium]|nr:NAD(P)H-dependent oxidoreductase [Clostridia bacterium]